MNELQKRIQENERLSRLGSYPTAPSSRIGSHPTTSRLDHYQPTSRIESYPVNSRQSRYSPVINSQPNSRLDFHQTTSKQRPVVNPQPTLQPIIAWVNLILNFKIKQCLETSTKT